MPAGLGRARPHARIFIDRVTQFPEKSCRLEPFEQGRQSARLQREPLGDAANGQLVLAAKDIECEVLGIGQAQIVQQWLESASPTSARPLPVRCDW